MDEAVNQHSNSKRQIPSSSKETKKMKIDDNPVSISIETVIKSIQALPDMDEDLVLDAVDFLEDKNKAEIFMALDVKFRRNWLIRKLRLEKKILLLVMMFGGKWKRVLLDVLTTNTIADVKAKVQAKEGIRAKDYRLKFKEQILQDSMTLADCSSEHPWRTQEFIMEGQGPLFELRKQEYKKYEFI